MQYILSFGEAFLPVQRLGASPRPARAVRPAAASALPRQAKRSPAPGPPSASVPARTGRESSCFFTHEPHAKSTSLLAAVSASFVGWFVGRHFLGKSPFESGGSSSFAGGVRRAGTVWYPRRSSKSEQCMPFLAPLRLQASLVAYQANPSVKRDGLTAAPYLKR